MASGNTLLQFGAADNEPPASNYATLDTRNGHLVLDFDASADEAAIFSGIMPRHYAGGGVTVYLHLSASGITTGNYIFDVAWERVGDGSQDVDSDGFAAAQSLAATAVPGTDGHVDIVSVAFTDGAQMDGVLAGEKFRLKVTRDADNASDTAAADIELHAIEVKES
jgi:hypothetical protein